MRSTKREHIKWYAGCCEAGEHTQKNTTDIRMCASGKLLACPRSTPLPLIREVVSYFSCVCLWLYNLLKLYQLRMGQLRSSGTRAPRGVVNHMNAAGGWYLNNSPHIKPHIIRPQSVCVTVKI